MASPKKKSEAVEPQAVATQPQAGALSAVAAPNLADWGTQAIDVRKIIIARILPQQPMSKYVVEGKAMMGDIMESSNGTKLASITQPLEFIPFHHVETWIEFEVVPPANAAAAATKKFLRMIPVAPENDALPLSEVIAGKEISRDRALEYFVLLPSDLAKGIKRPYVLSFRRTSSKAGKKLYTTMFVTNPANGRIPAATVCKLSGTRTTNDRGTFIVTDVTEFRDSTNVEMQAAFEWFRTISTSKNVVVDNSSLDAEGGAAAPEATGPAQF